MLNSPKISETAIESSTLALLNEWLGTFFDGGRHAVGYAPAVNFPTADVRFQEGAHPQPLNGIGLRVTWVRGGKATLRWETVGGVRQHMATQPATWMFWVRADAAKREDAQRAAMTAAELLYAILQNSAASSPLTQRGIHHLRAEQPQLGGVGGGAKNEEPFYALRFLSATATLRYPVLSQPPAE